MRKFLSILAIAGLIPFMGCLAQNDEFGTWFSAGIEKKIMKGLSAGAEAEYRLTDFNRTDRWTAGASLSYRLYRNEKKTFDVKAEAGVKFMKVYNPESVNYKDTVMYEDVDTFYECNVLSAYNVNKIRASLSVSAAVKVNRFKFSIRERYQYTGNDSVCVDETKWRYDKKTGGMKAKEDFDWKAVNNRRHTLRSRFQASYDIRNFPVTPYASIEVYNDLKDSFALEKVRYLFGLDFEFAKQHDVKLYYVYQNHADDDEPGGHAVGLSYAFEF